MNRSWSTSVQTQGIRLRRRALSSTAPCLATRIERKVAVRAAQDTQRNLSPAMVAALTDISNMKDD